MDKDEGIRYPVDTAKLAKLPLLREGGRLTAALASQITDGASAVLIVNERGLKKLGLKPRARVAGMALAGDDPVMMLRCVWVAWKPDACALKVACRCVFQCSDSRHAESTEERRPHH